MTYAANVRVGVAEFNDGWNVVVDWDGDVKVYDPTYATEAEARGQASRTVAELRRVAATVGLRIEGKR